MNNNKKGITEIFTSVMGIAFVAFACIFAFLFIKNMFLTELIPPIQSNATSILEQNGNDTVLINLINEQDDNFSNVDFRIDLLFLGLWFGSTILGAIASAAMRKLNALEFLGTIFIGVILLLLGLNYIDQIFTWLVQSFITDTFSAAETYLPIFDFYVTNFILINVITFIGFLMINQLTRREEETLTQEFEESNRFQSVEERGFDEQ